MTVLDFGALDLMDGEIVRLEALGTDSGTDWGNPQPIEVQLNSFVQYGALVASEGWENRVVMLAVVAQSESADSIADAELALAAEVGKPNTLRFQPPNGLVPTVYKVLTSHFDKVPDDLALVADGGQVFMIRLVCEPFAYSEDERVVEALGPPPVSPVTATVDDGTSAAGWFASWNGTSLTPSTGTFNGRSMVVTGSPAKGSQVTMILRRIGAIDTTTTKYLVVDWAWSGGYPNNAGLTCTAPGVSVAKISEGASPVSGDTRTVFRVSSSVTSIGDLTFSHTTDNARLGSFAVAQSRYLLIDNISRTDAPNAANGRQQLRSFNVEGSAPTTGSISLEHETSALGDGASVFTYPADVAASTGYSPQCSPFYLSSGGAATPDASAVSGGSWDLATARFFSFPAMALPDGEYAVWARLKGAAASAPIGWNVSPQLPVGTGIGATEAYAATVALGGSVWRMVPLGMVHLPVIDTGLVGSTLVGIGTQDGSSVLLDEVWLYNLSIGDLTVVNLGTGTPSPGGPSKRLWIDSPSLSNDGLGALMRGHSTDRSDSFSAYPNALAPGIHRILPGGNKMFTVTPNVPAAQAALRYTPAWLHTAAA